MNARRSDGAHGLAAAAFAAEALDWDAEQLAHHDDAAELQGAVAR